MCSPVPIQRSSNLHPQLVGPSQEYSEKQFVICTYYLCVLKEHDHCHHKCYEDSNAVFPSLVARKISNTVQDQFVDLQNHSWKKNSLLIFTPCLPHHSHPVHRDQTKELVSSVSRVKTNTGARAFHSCAPALWNYLPLYVHSAISVATFKKHLKTHLFDLAFPS